MSGRFTPAAATLISTSPAAGTGVGRSAATRTSGPPGSRISIASIVFTFLFSLFCFHFSVFSSAAEGGGRRHGFKDKRRQNDAEREADREDGGQRAHGGHDHAVDEQQRAHPDVD